MCECVCVYDEHLCIACACACVRVQDVHVHVRHYCEHPFIYPDQDQALALACELYTPELHAMFTHTKSEALGQMPISQQCALRVNYLFVGGSTLEHKIPASTPNLIPCVVIISFQ